MPEIIDKNTLRKKMKQKRNALTWEERERAAGYSTYPTKCPNPLLSAPTRVERKQCIFHRFPLQRSESVLYRDNNAETLRR